MTPNASPLGLESVNDDVLATATYFSTRTQFDSADYVATVKWFGLRIIPDGESTPATVPVAMPKVR